MNEHEPTPEDFDCFREGMAAINDSFAQMAEVVSEAARKLVGAWSDFVIPLVAEAGIGELEMDLKLRSEVALNTDLLSLFDEGGGGP